MQAANENNAYTENDTFAWCDCGCGSFWLWLNPDNGFYHVVCSQCDHDHTNQVCG